MVYIYAKNNEIYLSLSTSSLLRQASTRKYAGTRYSVSFKNSTTAVPIISKTIQSQDFTRNPTTGSPCLNSFGFSEITVPQNPSQPSISFYFLLNTESSPQCPASISFILNIGKNFPIIGIISSGT